MRLELNILIITYLPVARTRNENIELIQCLLKEVNLFVIKTCLFILSILNKLGFKSSEFEDQDLKLAFHCVLPVLN